MFRPFEANLKDPEHLNRIRQIVAETPNGPNMAAYRPFETDLVFAAADATGSWSGMLCARPVILLHQFRLRPGIHRRRLAESLSHYALGWGRANGYSQGILLVDKGNAPMLQFTSDMGATEDPGQGSNRLFYLDIL